MCSLSRTMKSFKIHEDDENSLPTTHLSAKLSQLGPIQQTRRVALGEIQTNVENKPVGKLENPGDLKNDPAAKENGGKNLPTCRPVLGDVKNLGNVPGKPEIPSKDLLAKKDESKFIPVDENKLTSDRGADKSHRSPLKEIVPNENDKVLEKLSPMWIDDSPLVKTKLPKSIKLQLEDLYSCVTYKEDIFEYLKQRELQFKPKPFYMKRQPDVTYTMRTILVDWLVEVGEEYKLTHSTLFLTVSFVDRFLSQMAVIRGKLQLLGTAAMFLASKFEEIYPPEVGEFTYITDDSYTKTQVLKMENMILKVLDYNLSIPTSYTFIMHIAASVRLPDKVMFLAIFLCELTLLEADPYLAHPPSLIASGAIALAHHCLDYVDVWPKSLQQTTGYTLKQLAPVVNSLNETHQKSFKADQRAIRDKYNSAKFLLVSKIPHRKLSIRVE